MAEFNPLCPTPFSTDAKITLAHGSGGIPSAELVSKLFVPALKNKYLELLHDGAVFELGNSRLAFTTDSFVVKPIFFPGGDIGSLSVHGTVNDLAMCGARPLMLSLSFIIEEGFLMADLARIVKSISNACKDADVMVVTGDTKVVEKGSADGIFINTTGVGTVEYEGISPKAVRSGDNIILNGAIGLHGIAVMVAREGLNLETDVESDSAPLWGPVEKVLKSGAEVHCLRDATRGGLSSVLNEIASAADVGIEIWEDSIPVPEPVRGACEILGLDPLYIANEGRFLSFVASGGEDRAVDALRAHPLGRDARKIGQVTNDHKGSVVLRTNIGGRRVVPMASGELLPRIC
ncbi:MAG TPA: hydrogenase expression/formation protein HypE [Candidatus Avalokitesvara rifleensis]|uniref:hydrogenase expression/formation protein HypE n=1 Tax=Candidatus Avalokitesvara rifleensis TaxID=3367620 RepID=UPI0027131B36|nr:hydrogenase expression/formation protein HypE [Candidatus Brocadiales bacterium]